jgi:excisionase family DNA binding protein
MLTPDELAGRWGVDRKTIYKAVTLKQLPAVRIGKKLLLIPLAAVEALEQGRVEPESENHAGPAR